jgi:hypothetical protein
MISRSLRRFLLVGGLTLTACFPIRDLGCNCSPQVSEETKQKIAAGQARSLELVTPWVVARGEYLRVHDPVPDVGWVAIEPGAAALKPGSSYIPADGDFELYFTIEARRSDRPDMQPSEVGISFTMLAGPSGPAPVAVTVSTIRPNAASGGKMEERRFHACPIGEMHYATWGPGESPCHHVALVPVIRCGCTDVMDFAHPEDCAKYESSPEPKLKKDCRRANGEPAPP